MVLKGHDHLMSYLTAEEKILIILKTIKLERQITVIAQ